MQNLCKLEDLNVSGKLFCSFCNAKFEDQVQQRLHYKLDWHRYNLKQKLNGLEPVTEEKFTQLAGMRIGLLHVNFSVVIVTYFHFNSSDCCSYYYYNHCHCNRNHHCHCIHHPNRHRRLHQA